MRPPGVQSGQALLELRKARMNAAPAVLQAGFRPFFLAAGVWAVVAIALWMCVLEGLVSLPGGMDALAWHRHEMVFGFAGAAVAGFVLTAIPNWTGRFPVAGPPLAGLASLWIAARLLVLLLPMRWLTVAAVFDAGLFVLLAGYALREVRLAKNRNLPIALLILVFGAADALDYSVVLGGAGDALLGIRAGFAILIVMISVVGGRIVPSFTRNWLTKASARARLPGQPTRFDIGVIGATTAALGVWIAAPAARVSGGLLIAAAILQAVRLARWRGFSAMREPLLFVLHLGYFWLALGLLILGLAIVSSLVPASAAIHALGIGAIGTMILAVTTRASLGHTGRKLRAPGLIVLAYGLISLAAIARIGAAFGWMDYLGGLRLAAGVWIGAFALFLFVYVPVLTQKRRGDA